MHKVFLGLGSNIGNKKENLDTAIDKLNANDLIDVQKVSKFINTKAVSKVKQPDFLNAAIQIQTILSPLELLEFTAEIEKGMGRTSKGNEDPRTIDIDILLFDDEIVCMEGLTIPHPFMHERLFVLEPLMEIGPDIIHPVVQESISTLFHQQNGY